MTQNEPAAIENAEAIIERFGGIRPMATKINVPVTTVQGWKKRNVIPGTRRAEILQAANQLGVDLSDVMQSAKPTAPIANENDRLAIRPAPRVEERPAAPPSFNDFVEQQGPQNFVPNNPSQSFPKSSQEISAHLEQKLAQTERRAVTKSTFINIFLVVLVVGSVALLLWPQQEQRFAAIENDVNALEEKQSFFSKIIPGNIEAKLSALQSQADKLQSGLTGAIGRAKDASEYVASTTPANIEERVVRLESNLSEMTGMPASSHLSGLLARFEGWSESVGGQAKLSSAVGQLSSMLAGVPAEDPAMVEQALQSAPEQNPELAETFAGVPPQDVKAAALLLGMTQFRSSLNRDNQPFETDLALLKKLVGTDDPALVEAIDRLAPYAQQGVLTPSGLTSEFRGIAGDVVVASLQGEDVSIKDKAQARLGEMFQIEKDGEPIGGTPTQNTLAKTDKLLQGGDLEGAISQMQMLDGPALVAAQPWLTQANATLMANKVKSMLTQTVSKGTIYNTSGPLPSATRGLNIPPSSELMQQDSSSYPGIQNITPEAGSESFGPEQSETTSEPFYPFQ